MDRMRSRDIELLADVAANLGAMQNLAAFRAGALGQIRRLVACEISSYNEIELGTQQVTVIADPASSASPPAVEAFAAYADQNPLVALHARTPDAPAARLSDFLTRRQLHALELYDLVYGPLSVEHQVAIAIPANDRLIAITASRQALEFNRRELGLLNAARPFLITALRNLQAGARIDAMLSALGQAERAPAAILLLSTTAGPEPADERSERWLAAANSAQRLLAELSDWARQTSNSPSGDGHHSVQEHAFEHPQGTHTARLIPGCPPRPATILISPATNPIAQTDLTHLGLTHRQAEVLGLVKAGLSNAAIARTLGLSQRTIAHHLEHIYHRLGVTSRTAALRHADQHPTKPPHQ